MVGSDILEIKQIENIEGSAYNDTLLGDDGNNVLLGQSGADILTGRGGVDVFTFDTATAFNGVDSITDFNQAEGDALDISDLLAGYDPLTDALSDFVSVTDDGTDSFVSVDIDGAGTAYAMTQIATLEDITGLDEAALLASSNLIV